MPDAAVASIIAIYHYITSLCCCSPAQALKLYIDTEKEIERVEQQYKCHDWHVRAGWVKH